MRRHTIAAALAIAATTALGAGAALAGAPEPPTGAIEYTCGPEGATLLILVIDESTFRYDVYIDEELVIDFESDPDGEPWEFGPYPDGTDLFVEIFWYSSPEAEESDLLANGQVLLDCSPDDTGVPTTDGASGGAGPGTLPSTGGSDTTLVVTALALLTAGGALLATRRRPRNA